MDFFRTSLLWNEFIVEVISMFMWWRHRAASNEQKLCLANKSDWKLSILTAHNWNPMLWIVYNVNDMMGMFTLHGIHNLNGWEMEGEREKRLHLHVYHLDWNWIVSYCECVWQACCSNRQAQNYGFKRYSIWFKQSKLPFLTIRKTDTSAFDQLFNARYCKFYIWTPCTQTHLTLNSVFITNMPYVSHLNA